MVTQAARTQLIGHYQREAKKYLDEAIRLEKAIPSTRTSAQKQKLIQKSNKARKEAIACIELAKQAAGH